MVFRYAYLGQEPWPPSRSLRRLASLERPPAINPLIGGKFRWGGAILGQRRGAGPNAKKRMDIPEFINESAWRPLPSGKGSRPGLTTVTTTEFSFDNPGRLAMAVPVPYGPPRRVRERKRDLRAPAPNPDCVPR